ncbi:MAG: helical backbone metal receptor [Saprospiraceae bacterium]
MWLDPNGFLQKNKKNQKIACLVPSLTELFLEYGLYNQLVARTKFCVHPHAMVRSIPKIGGTKKVNLAKLKSLNPDIVVANKEENTLQDIQKVTAFAPVFVSDIQTLDDLESFVSSFSKAVPEFKALSFIKKLQNLIWNVPHLPKTVAYLIWNDPMMTIGHDTFIHHILSIGGFVNVFAERSRYPIVTWEELSAKNMDYIFLSSEPFPFSNKHLQFFSEKLPNSKTILVDGEMFSWYGSKVLKMPEYLFHLQRTFEK